MTHLVIGAGLLNLSTTTTSMLEQIFGGFLLVVAGAKGVGYIAQDKIGAAIGVAVIAIVPAMFLLVPSVATTFLTDTVNYITGTS